MTNNTTSYVNNQTMKELHNNPTARAFLVAIETACASFVTALDIIDNGDVPSQYMYSGINPANIVCAVNDKQLRYKTIGLYTRWINNAICGLIERGFIKEKGDLFKFVKPFNPREQADSFLMAYTAIK